MLFLFFVALWFILRGDLLYVFPCVILFLCFPVLLVLRLPRLGRRELVLVLFVRLFDLCLFGFVGFLFLLGLRRAAVCDCGTPWTFLLPFFFSLKVDYILALKEAQGSHCAACNIELLWAYQPKDTQQFSVDRLDNSVGHIHDNRLICLECNQKRGAAALSA